jgi:hypothetical protein
MIWPDPTGVQFPQSADNVAGQDRRQIALLTGHGNCPRSLQRIVEGPERPCNWGRASNILGITPRVYHDGQRVTAWTAGNIQVASRGKALCHH